MKKAMLNKQDYIKSQRAKEQQAIKDGYDWNEIRLAYKNQREIRKVGYLDKHSLENAREEIKQLNKQ